MTSGDEPEYDVVEGELLIRDPLIGELHEHLIKLSAAAQDPKCLIWRSEALGVIVRFLRKEGFDQKLIAPFWAILCELQDQDKKRAAPRAEGKPGASSSPDGHALAMAMAAAAVTVLARRGDYATIGAAIEAVAKVTKIPRTQIKSARKNILSHTGTPAALATYERFVEEVSGWPTIDTLSSLGMFLKNPPIVRTGD